MAQAGDKITHIRVTNNNPFPIYDRYDGVQYVFAPEKPQNIPADVANHIFGYSPDATEDDMIKHIQRRFGWNTVQHVKDDTWLMYIDNIDIKPVVFKLVEVELKEDGDPVDAPAAAAPKRRPGRPKYSKKGKRILRPEVQEVTKFDPEPEADEPEPDAEAAA